MNKVNNQIDTKILSDLLGLQDLIGKVFTVTARKEYLITMFYFSINARALLIRVGLWLLASDHVYKLHIALVAISFNS